MPTLLPLLSRPRRLYSPPRACLRRYAGDAEGRGGIYNFVTKRGICLGERSKISWTQVRGLSSCAALRCAALFCAVLRGAVVGRGLRA